MQSAKDDNVRVAVRCRPLNSTEKAQGCEVTVAVDSRHGRIDLTDPKNPTLPPKTYTFDNCFGPDSIQADVYNITARPIVDAAMEGFNGTIFAYGQTGTGKTHTMEGDRNVPELRGIIPNSFAHIFGHIAKAQGATRFLVRCSYLEIYCEEVRDLLGADQKQKLDIKEHPDVGVYVKGLTSCVVRSAEDMDKIMTKGNLGRMVGETKMNARSSRSHAIYTVTIERSDVGPDGKDSVRMGKLNLVDLAGSERQSKTGAEGQRLIEATKINLSLTTLGNVISALVDGKSTHVPYRDSRLTRLLQDSLGGNSKTVMIANFGPADYNYDETANTLRYANRAKQIKNTPKVNEDPKDALLREYQKEIERLKRELEEGGGGGAGGDGEDETDDGDSDSDGDDGGAGGGKKSKGEGRKGGKKSRRPMTPSKVSQMQAALEREKAALKKKTDLTAEERSKIAHELKQREEILTSERIRNEKLSKQLDDMKSKLIVGGDNLLEKVNEQERLLEEARKEMELRKRRESAIEKEIKSRDDEVFQLEEQYLSLQEEAAGKTRKLKKVWTMLQASKDEIEALQKERVNQTDDLLASIRDLSRELRLSMLVIDSFIPPEFQDLIEKQAVWSEQIGDWQLPGIAYTGNNLQKTAAAVGQDPNSNDLAETDELQLLVGAMDTEKCFLSYGNTIDGDRPPKSARPKTAVTRTEKTATPARPKTGKARPDAPPAAAAASANTSGNSSAVYPVHVRPSTAKARYA